MSEENNTPEQETPVSGHEARHTNTDTAPADTTPATDEAKTE